MNIALKLVVNRDVLDLEKKNWEFILVMCFLKHANMQQTKKLHRLKICIYQNYPRRFANVHNLAQKIKKK